MLLPVVDPAHRWLWVMVVVTVVLGSAIAAILLYPYAAAWNSLPVPAGTEITSDQALLWVAHFSVGPGGGTLVGAWTAYSGAGDLGPTVVNGTVEKPQPAPGLYSCPMEFPWDQTNGTLEERLAPGAYTMYWNTFCLHFSKIVVTQTIQVVPS